jgi:hypothetical protein
LLNLPKQLEPRLLPHNSSQRTVACGIVICLCSNLNLYREVNNSVAHRLRDPPSESGTAEVPLQGGQNPWDYPGLEQITWAWYRLPKFELTTQAWNDYQGLEHTIRLGTDYQGLEQTTWAWNRLPGLGTDYPRLEQTTLAWSRQPGLGTDYPAWNRLSMGHEFSALSINQSACLSIRLAPGLFVLR